MQQMWRDNNLYDKEKIRQMWQERAINQTLPFSYEKKFELPSYFLTPESEWQSSGSGVARILDQGGPT